jgi:hypothetical protein
MIGLIYSDLDISIRHLMFTFSEGVCIGVNALDEALELFMRSKFLLRLFEVLSQGLRHST